MSEVDTLSKSVYDDQNPSQSKRNDQGDSDRLLSTSEPILSPDDLSSIFFI